MYADIMHIMCLYMSNEHVVYINISMHVLYILIVYICIRVACIALVFYSLTDWRERKSKGQSFLISTRNCYYSGAVLDREFGRGGVGRRWRWRGYRNSGSSVRYISHLDTLRQDGIVLRRGYVLTDPTAALRFRQLAS